MALQIGGGGGQNRVRVRGQGNDSLNTTTKWEMVEMTIGVIPDFNNESAVDGLNGKVQYIQLKGGDMFMRDHTTWNTTNNIWIVFKGI